MTMMTMNPDIRNLNEDESKPAGPAPHPTLSCSQTAKLVSLSGKLFPSLFRNNNTTNSMPDATIIDANITMPSTASQAELAHIEMYSGNTDCDKEKYTSTGIFSTIFANTPDSRNFNSSGNETTSTAMPPTTLPTTVQRSCCVCAQENPMASTDYEQEIRCKDPWIFDLLKTNTGGDLALVLGKPLHDNPQDHYQKAATTSNTARARARRQQQRSPCGECGCPIWQCTPNGVRCCQQCTPNGVCCYVSCQDGHRSLLERRTTIDTLPIPEAKRAASAAVAIATLQVHAACEDSTSNCGTDSSTEDESDSSSNSTQYEDEELFGAPTQEPYFIVDSGASSNMADKDLIKHLPDVKRGLPSDLAIAGIGGKTMTATAEANCGEHHMTIFEGLGCNLLSVHQLCKDSKVCIVFTSGGMCLVPNKAAAQLMNNHQHGIVCSVSSNGLYKVRLSDLDQALQALRATRQQCNYCDDESETAEETKELLQRSERYKAHLRGGNAHSAELHLVLLSKHCGKPGWGHLPTDLETITEMNDDHDIEDDNSDCDAVDAYLADYVPTSQILLLHQRMGHASLDLMKLAVAAGNTYGTRVTLKQLNALHQLQCKICCLSKLKKLRLPTNTKEERQLKRHTVILRLIGTDTAGPRTEPMIKHYDRNRHKRGGEKYWQVFCDHHSLYLWEAHFHKKSQLPKVLKYMERQMEMDARNSVHAPGPGGNQLKVQAYRTDNAGELSGKEFIKELHERMIDHERTVPSRSVQNALAETAILVVQDRARCLLADAGMAIEYTMFAIAYAVYQINRQPCRANPENKSRYEMFYGRKPKTNCLRTFGAAVTMYLPITKRVNKDKQSPSGLNGNGRFRFVGVPHGGNGYLIFDTETTQVLVRRDIHWQEDMTEIHESAEVCDSHSESESYSDSSSDSSQDLSDASSESALSNSDTDDSSDGDGENETSSDNEDDDSDPPRGEVVLSIKGDKIKTVAERHNVDPELLCILNMFNGKKASPSSKLMTNTELFLPTEEEARDYAKLYANAQFGAVSEEGIPPVFEKDCNNLGANTARPNEHQRITHEEGKENFKKFMAGFKAVDVDEDPTKYNDVKLDQDEINAESLEYQLKQAALHAGMPPDCCIYAESPKDFLNTAVNMAARAVQHIHRKSKAGRRMRRKEMLQCKNLSRHAFLCAANHQRAYLVEKLKDRKAVDLPTPKTVREALDGDFEEFWREAILLELKQMNDKKVWHWAHLPIGRKAMDTKWVLKIKANQQGLVDRFKARLVGRGFKGILGVDYWKTHASVVRKESLRLLIAHAAHNDLDHKSIDISGAFLEADTDRKVYVEVKGEGIDDLIPPEPGMVYCLDKSLYGIKQAPRQWMIQITNDLLSWGFVQHRFDPCLFMKRNSETDYCIVALYVDDMSITTTKAGNQKAYDSLIKSLTARYKCSPADDRNVYLGIRINKTGPGHYSMDQERYVVDLLKKYGFNLPEVNVRKYGNMTPSSVGSRETPLTKDDCPKTQLEIDEMNKLPYRQIVGSLRHLEQWTRPDISAALNILSTFQANPGKKHWRELSCLVKYVAATRHMALHYGKAANPASKMMGHDLNKQLECFVDANWGTCKDTRLSRTGYVFFSRNGCVAWRSRKQVTQALSTCEAEFMAASDAACENAYLRFMQHDLQEVIQTGGSAPPAGATDMWGEMMKEDYDASNLPRVFDERELPITLSALHEMASTTVMHEDNQGAMATAEAPTLHKRMKHVDIRYHRIRDFIKIKQVRMVYCKTQNQIADIFTKNLAKTLFKRFRDCLVQPTNTPRLT